MEVESETDSGPEEGVELEEDIRLEEEVEIKGVVELEPDVKLDDNVGLEEDVEFDEWSCPIAFRMLAYALPGYSRRFCDSSSSPIVSASVPTRLSFPSLSPLASQKTAPPSPFPTTHSPLTVALLTVSYDTSSFVDGS